MEVIRSAAEAGLIPDIPRFRTYRDRRNMTCHTYNQPKAEEVLSVLDQFAADARHLLNRLVELNLDRS